MCPLPADNFDSALKEFNVPVAPPQVGTETGVPTGGDEFDSALRRFQGTPVVEQPSAGDEFDNILKEFQGTQAAEQPPAPKPIGEGFYFPDQQRIAVPFSQADQKLQLSDINRAIDRVNPQPHDNTIQELWSMSGNREQVAADYTKQIASGNSPDSLIDIHPFDQLKQIQTQAEKDSGNQKENPITSFIDSLKKYPNPITATVMRIPVVGEAIESGSIEAIEMALRATRFLGDTIGLDTSSIGAVLKNAEDAKKPYEEALKTYGPIRRTITKTASQGIAATEIAFPAMSAAMFAPEGVAASIAASWLAGAVTTSTVFGLSETDQFLEEAEKAGISRKDALPRALISGGTTMAANVLAELIVGNTFGLIGPVREAVTKPLLQAAGRAVGRTLMASQVWGGVLAASAELQSKLRRDIDIPAPARGKAALPAYKGGVLLSLFFAPFGLAGADIRARETNKRFENEQKGDWAFTKGSKPFAPGNNYIKTKDGAVYQGKETVTELQGIYDIKNSELDSVGQLVPPKKQPASPRELAKALVTSDTKAMAKQLDTMNLRDLQDYTPASVFASTRKTLAKTGMKRSEIDTHIKRFAGRYTTLWEDAVAARKGEMVFATKTVKGPELRFEGFQENIPPAKAFPLFTVMGGKSHGSTFGPSTLKAMGIDVPKVDESTAPGTLFPETKLSAKRQILTTGDITDAREVIKRFPQWLKDAGFKEMADKVDLEVRDFVKVYPEKVVKSMEAHAKRGEGILKKEQILGSAELRNFKAVIQLATKVGNIDEMRQATYHELYHIAEMKLLTGSEQKQIERAIPNMEDRADMFAEYVMDRNSHKGQPGAVRAWWGKLHSLLTRIHNWLKGNGFYHPEDLFGEIVSGETVKAAAPAEERFIAASEAKEAQPIPVEGVSLASKLDYEKIATKHTEDIPKGLRAAYTKHIGDPLWKYLSGDIPRIMGDRFLFIDAVNRGIITDYKKDPKFLQIRDETFTKIDKAQRYAEELANELAKLTKAEQVRASQIIEGSVTTKSEKFNAALRAHDAFQRAKRGLRETGLLGPDNRFDKLTRAALAEKHKEVIRLNEQIARKQKALKPITDLRITVKNVSSDITEALISRTEKVGGEYQVKVSKWNKLNEGRVKEALVARGFGEGEAEQMIGRIKDSVTAVEGKTGTVKEVREILERTITKTVNTEILKTKTFSRLYMSRARVSIARDIQKLVDERNEILGRLWKHDHISSKSYLRKAYQRIEEEKSLQNKIAGYLKVKRPRLIKGYEKQRQDLTEAYKQYLGEIKTAPYLVMKGLSHETHDMMLMRMFQAVAKNRKWAMSAKAWDNLSRLKDRANEFELVKDFKELPDNPRLGPLRGAMIDKYIWDDLNQSVVQSNQVMQVYDGILRLWKTGKVVYNPATHMRNLMSNIILADWADLPIHKINVYIKAAQELKNKGEFYREAQDSGLFGHEWAGEEIAKFLDAAAEIKSGTMISNAITLVKKAMDVPGSAYQGMEQYFKLAVFINERSKGKSVVDAKNHAEKFLFNYGKVPPAIRWAKRWYSPFITFSYKAVPRFLETIVTRPWKIGKYAMLYLAVEQGGRLLMGESQDELDREKRVLPDYMRKSVLPGMISHLRLPYKDKFNRSKWLDLSYILPWGDIAEQWGQSSMVGRPFLPTHPLWISVGEIAFNRVLFTGQDLTIKDLDEGADYWKKIGTEIWRQAVPSLGGGYGFSKLMAAAIGEKDWAGRERSVPEAIFDTLLGIKIRSIDYRESYERRMRKYQQLIGAERQVYANEYRHLMLNPPADHKELIKKNAEIMAKANARIQRIMDKITGLTDLRKD